MRTNKSHAALYDEHGKCPYIAHIPREACHNENFCRAFWTGEHLQMMLMDIMPCGETGLEVHNLTEQFIRVEQGRAVLKMGASKRRLDVQRYLCQGDAIFIPAGVWYNIMNAGKISLKLSSVYASPRYPSGTVHHTKRHADKESISR